MPDDRSCVCRVLSHVFTILFSCVMLSFFYSAAAQLRLSVYQGHIPVCVFSAVCAALLFVFFGNFHLFFSKIFHENMSMF